LAFQQIVVKLRNVFKSILTEVSFKYSFFKICTVASIGSKINCSNTVKKSGLLSLFKVSKRCYFSKRSFIFSPVADLHQKIDKSFYVNFLVMLHDKST